MFTPSALGRTKIKRTLPSCRAMQCSPSARVMCHVRRGWMDGDDKPRRTRSAEEGKRIGRDCSPRQKLASESIMSEAGEWHRLQGTTTATTTYYPIRQLCQRGRASGRKLITRSVLSPSVCLKSRKSRGEFSTASFFPTSRRWNEWPPAMRGDTKLLSALAGQILRGQSR